MANLSADRRKKALMPDTPAKIQRILKSIKRGIPQKIATEAAGLHESHFYNLLNQGLNDLEAQKDTVQSRMVESLRNIEEDSIGSSLDLIRASEKGHKGSEWFLERRYWQYFGQNVSVVELAAQMEEFKAQLEKQNKEKDSA